MKYRNTLTSYLPENWNDLGIYERRSFLSGDLGADKKGTVPRTRVCVSEIWAECLNGDSKSLTRSISRELHNIMYRIPGWTKYSGNKSGKMRFALYGPQRAYVRENKSDTKRIQ